MRFRVVTKQLKEQDGTIADIFVKYRILLADKEGAIASYQMVHETIKHKWDWMRDWIEQADDELKTYALFSSDAKLWSKKRSPSNVLYSDGHYEKLRLLCADNVSDFEGAVVRKLGITPETDTIEYVKAFLEYHDEHKGTEKQKRKKAIRPYRNGLIVITAAASLGLFAASWFWTEDRESIYSAHKSEQASLISKHSNEVAEAKASASAAAATVAAKLTAQEVAGCWTPISDFPKPVDCNFFELEVTPQGQNDFSTGVLRRTCNVPGARTAEAVFSLQGGAVEVPSMYGLIPGTWRFVSNGNGLLWSAESPNGETRLGAYKRCSSPG